MAKCDICGKAAVFGRNIRHKHSGRWQRKAPRTNRSFNPNVHKQTLYVDGMCLSAYVCTRCLRNQVKAPR